MCHFSIYNMILQLPFITVINKVVSFCLKMLLSTDE